MAPKFLYPRVVDIRRESAREAAGIQEYGANSPAEESVVAAGLAAHIQIDRQSQQPGARLPSDARGQSMWTIIFPRMAPGFVLSRDVVVDELGNRYQVISADWGPLVTSCQAQIMEN